ncbi:hypothetical protein GY45DRAFT_1341222 [Cubamyces sp. BRFM 1775]|nr:hypothetical protein GY45DRAFT_1341222 [Cubamyces sp. BRFM 1775]
MKAALFVRRKIEDIIPRKSGSIQSDIYLPALAAEPPPPAEFFLTKTASPTVVWLKNGSIEASDAPTETIPAPPPAAAPAPLCATSLPRPRMNLSRVARRALRPSPVLTARGNARPTTELCNAREKIPKRELQVETVRAILRTPAKQPLCETLEDAWKQRRGGAGTPYEVMM